MAAVCQLSPELVHGAHIPETLFPEQWLLFSQLSPELADGNVVEGLDPISCDKFEMPFGCRP